MQDILNRNRLGSETSPYLRQHETNPVHWQPWEPQVLAAAAEIGKPILLSVGYAACHWCHVMAHESFEDDEVAELMNGLFVNIKIDREERPDLDALYQRAFNLIGGQGGWPLTMFLTPKGEPFWGGTYFPKESAYGRPGFKELLVKLSEVYHEQPATVAKNVATIREALEKSAHRDRTDQCPADLLTRVAEAVLPHMDGQNGGLKGAPKFPQATLLRLYIEATLADPSSEAGENNQYTYQNWLTSLCQGGIYDHVGGGFARYCVDDIWLVPHFEKMLYDNAQILSCLTAACRLDKNPLYKARTEETVSFILSEMRGAEGGFISSYDADSEGKEGAFYVWQEEELKKELGADFEGFAQTYDVSAQGDWEEANILNRLNSRNWEGDEKEADFREILDRLRAHRASRIPPGADHKVLTDWNGLLIRALAEAARLFNRSDWLDAARQAFDFIVKTMKAGEHRLFHTYADGKVHIKALAEDYANMAAAALTLYEVTGNTDYSDQALKWIETLEQDFWDDASGGFFQSPHSSTDLITRAKPSTDTPMPAVNGTMVEVYARAEVLTGENFKAKLEALISLFAISAMREPVGHASFILGFDFMLHRTELVVIGKRGDTASDDLMRAATEAPFPQPVLQVIEETTALPENHPARGKTAVEGKPTLYICRNQTCSAPITDPRQVTGQLPPL